MIHSRATRVEAKDWQVLDVLGQQEWPAVEHEGALAPAGAAEPEMFGQGTAERPAADDDEIKRSEVAARGQTGGAAGIGVNRDEHIVEGIAHVSSKHIAREIGVWRE